MVGVPIDASNWLLFENLILQCALIEPGTLPFVLRQFVTYKQMNYPLSLSKIGDTFNQIIQLHAPLGHGSEVAWAIWGSIALHTFIEDASVSVLSNMNDPIVALLVLDARHRTFISKNATFPLFETYMTQHDLYGDFWLVSYEANVKGWLPSLEKQDHVDADPCFGILKANNVHFYDTSASVTPEQIAVTEAEISGMSF